MKKAIPENLKATLAFGISSFFTSGINYIVTPIITRLTTKTEYGLISVYNSVYAIISVIATLTLIKPGLLSVGMYEHKENRWKYLSSMIGLISAATLVTGAVLLGFYPVLKSILRLPISLVILIILTCWINPAFIFWTYKQKYEYKYKITFLVTVGTALVAQIVSVLSVYYCYKTKAPVNKAIIRLWSAAAVNLVVGVVLMFYIVSKGKKIIDTPLWKSALIIAIPLIPHYLGFAFLNGTDKIMIDMMVGTDKAGIYSLAAVISTIGSLLWSALCVTITPFINEMLGRREFGSIDKNVYPLLKLIGVVCICVSLMAPEIIRILGTKDYLEGIYVVPATVAGVFMHIVYDVFSHISFFHKKTVRIMVATIIAATINVILNYIFISKINYMAASYTTLVSFLVLAILHYYNAVQIEKTPIFNVKRIALLSLIIIGCCMTCNFLYNFIWIRYAGILLCLIYALVNWKQYFRAIVNMKI